MKRVLLFFTACILVGVIFFPAHIHEETEHQSYAPSHATPTHSAPLMRTLGRTESEGWALLIGMDDMNKTNVYGYEAVAALRDYLLSIGYSEENILLLGNASLDEAREGLKWLISHAKENSIAIFYYAGHGTRNAYESGLCLKDGILWERELKKALDDLLSNNAFIGIEACLSGNFADYMPCNSLGGPGRVVATSSGDWTLSYAVKEMGGIFSRYFIKEGLQKGMGDSQPYGNEDGKVSVEEAFKYAFSMVERQHPMQLPRMNDQYPGDLVL